MSFIRSQSIISITRALHTILELGSSKNLDTNLLRSAFIVYFVRQLLFFRSMQSAVSASSVSFYILLIGT